jgi:hypothetical protein
VSTGAGHAALASIRRVDALLDGRELGAATSTAPTGSRRPCAG